MKTAPFSDLTQRVNRSKIIDEMEPDAVASWKRNPTTCERYQVSFHFLTDNFNPILVGREAKGKKISA